VGRTGVLESTLRCSSAIPFRCSMKWRQICISSLSCKTTTCKDRYIIGTKCNVAFLSSSTISARSKSTSRSDSRSSTGCLWLTERRSPRSISTGSNSCSCAFKCGSRTNSLTTSLNNMRRFCRTSMKRKRTRFLNRWHASYQRWMPNPWRTSRRSWVS